MDMLSGDIIKQYIKITNTYGYTWNTKYKTYDGKEMGRFIKQKNPEYGKLVNIFEEITEI